jgi:CheY-like chemotaxis protein
VLQQKTAPETRLATSQPHVDAHIAPRRSILVVDDDESMRALAQVHLRNAGYEVSLAEDAVTAGRMLLESTPDLLIVDVDMPYMDGLEFAATLMADRTIPYIPVVFITAHEQFARQARVLEADCLIKPFLADQLFEVVARNLVAHPG